MPQINIIDPLEYPDWDNLVLSNPDYSFFHSSGWARVLSESYGFKPLYFVRFMDRRLTALLPLMEASTLFFGRKGVSLPFTDHCFPLASDSRELHQFTQTVIDYGQKAGWRCVELRGDIAQTEPAPPYSSYYHHTLGLTRDHEEILAKFRASTKRNIDQAIKKKSMSAFFTLSIR